MDRQDKFLNKDYLMTRLRDFPEIKKKQILFEIVNSNRVFSKSIYINFFPCKELHTQHAIRISDHPHETAGQTQFIIEPNAELTKKKKQEFIRIVERVIKIARYNATNHYLNKYGVGGKYGREG